LNYMNMHKLLRISMHIKRWIYLFVFYILYSASKKIRVGARRLLPKHEGLVITKYKIYITSAHTDPSLLASLNLP
jgi:hypothetical protein